MTKFNLLVLAFLMACSTAASNAKDLKTEDETNLDLVANASRGLRRCADGSRHCHEYEKNPSTQIHLTMMTTRTTMIMITSITMPTVMIIWTNIMSTQMRTSATIMRAVLSRTQMEITAMNMIMSTGRI